MGKRIDMSGKSYGHWTVTGAEPQRRGRSTFWMARCACGVEKLVEASSLRDGESKHCGCQRVMSRGGMSKSMEYHSWNAMKQRVRSVPRYAAMSHDARWFAADGFAAFLADMGPRPPGTTLDRIENSQGYRKENCRWATPEVQTANRSVSRLILFDGQVMTFFRAVRLMHKMLQRNEATYHVSTVSLPRATARKRSSEAPSEPPSPNAPHG